MTQFVNSLTPKPSRFSNDEWAVRCELANAYQLIEYFGWSETIFNHISARVPSADHHYLVNPFGLLYTEVTPENLLKVDLDGNKVEFSPYDANPAGFALHSAIHGARMDVHCVIHTHTTEISAIAQKRAGFSHNDFYGAQFFGRVGYHEFEGITLFPEERERILASLGQKHILVLRNHGVAVGESSISRTMLLLWTVQRSAEIQCLADSMKGEESLLKDEIRDKSNELSATLIRDDGFADKFYDAIVRQMRDDRSLQAKVLPRSSLNLSPDSLPIRSE